MINHHIDSLENRRLFAYDILPPRVDLRADTDRDNVITHLDNRGELLWTPGAAGKGATVLPNVDKDNTTTSAPDNWSGGNWNGKHVGPNNIIDNDADLQDIARLRLLKLINVDSSFTYEITLKLLPALDDPAWLSGVKAQDRVRVFMPSHEVSGGRVLLQAGDAAVLGPGLGDTLRFIYDPKAPNEYPLSALTGDGYLELGVEGLKMGAGVRFELTVSYKPVIAYSVPASLGGGGLPGEPEPEVITDMLAMRVAPFTLLDHRNAVAGGKGSVYIDRFEENKQFRSVLRDVFGDRLIEGSTGDLWQQDGCEIGYVESPYGRMHVVLELPRSRGEPFTGGTGIRAFLRARLLRAGMGVSTEVAAYENDSSSAFGGDIESLPNPADPNGPGFLLRSAAMPTYLKQFFEAQNVNPVLEINPDRWLGVGHVDEIIQLSPNGKTVLMADADLGYALLLWAHKINPRTRMHAGMGSASSIPGYTEETGVTIAEVLKSGRLKRLNMEKVMDHANLPAAQRTIVKTLGLTAEISTPVSSDSQITLSRGGAFTQLLNGVRRSYEIKFLDGTRYELRYRDGKGPWSAAFTGRRDRDEVFPEAKAYLLQRFFSGTASAGDTITYRTNPDATFIRQPMLFVNSYTFPDFGGEPIPDGYDDEALNNPVVAFTSNFLNSLVDGKTVITPMSFAPRINYDGRGKRDLFDDYAQRAFTSAGYDIIRFVDARFYHNASGGVHCGTNVIRDMPI